MAPTTRAQRVAVRAGPPPLRRTSALVRIRFTPLGRRGARRLCLDDRSPYLMHFETPRGGPTVCVLERAEAGAGAHARRVVPRDAMPDYAHDA